MTLQGPESEIRRRRRSDLCARAALWSSVAWRGLWCVRL